MTEKDIAKASLANTKLHYIMAWSHELHKDSDMDFRAGIEFAKQDIRDHIQNIIDVNEVMSDGYSPTVIKTAKQILTFINSTE